MSTGKFQTPVAVADVNSRISHLVSTVGEAADFLFDNWPGHDSQLWTDAMNRCEAAKSGTTSIALARADFIKAVEQAGMKVGLALRWR